MARLILEFEGERREIRFAGPIIVGRSSVAAVCIDHRSLSREHARIELQNGRYVLQDLGSKNGTYLNGELLAQSAVLRAGDRIRVGPASLAFQLDPGEAAPPLVPTAGPASEAARARPRRINVEVNAPAAALQWMVNLLSVAVLGVGTYFFHEFFTWTFQRFLP